LRKKRPFFLEGKNIFDYGIDDDVMFYSRRIGHARLRSSHQRIQRGADQHPDSWRRQADGKNSRRLSVGVVQAFTDREVPTSLKTASSATRRSNR